MNLIYIKYILCKLYFVIFKWLIYISHQAKLDEIQSGKNDLADKVEALRTVKETAEQPEKEAKERHLRAWEGK